MKKGFTLIELLVVIAIIAILAAILFPVFARARAKAQQTVCLSNVKQIALAYVMYATDWNDTLPQAQQGGVWRDQPRFLTATCAAWSDNRVPWGAPAYFVGAHDMIYPYIRNDGIYTCPTDTIGGRRAWESGLPFTDQASYGLPNRWISSYATTYFLLFTSAGFPNWGTGSVKLSEVYRPSDIIAFGPGPSADGWGTSSVQCYPENIGPKAWGGSGAMMRHQGGANYAFMDGHAEWKPGSQVFFSIWWGPTVDGHSPPFMAWEPTGHWYYWQQDKPRGFTGYPGFPRE